MCDEWAFQEVRSMLCLIFRDIAERCSWTVNLGPVSSTMPGINPNPQSDGLGYNPRCLRRDINQHISSSWTKDNDTAWLIREHDDIGAFQRWMQGVLSSKFFGVHAVRG